MAQYFVQIRRADGSTYPTTVEADSIQEARRIAQNVGESGETVENITENTGQIGTGVGALTSEQMTSAIEDGPTTLDNLYREFERQRALEMNQATNVPIGEGQEPPAPLRSTGREAIGAGFQEGAYEGPMMGVAPRGQDFLTGPAPQETLEMAQRFEDRKMPAQESKQYENFNQYIDNFLSENAQLSGYALGVDKMAPGQGLSQSIMYSSGPVGSYFSRLFPEVQSTYMAEDVAKNMNLETDSKPVTTKSFDQFTSEMLSGGEENSLFNKQRNAFNKIVGQYKVDLYDPNKTSLQSSVAMTFSDKKENRDTVLNLVRGMATSMYGDNYMRYVNPSSTALYDAWSREQAEKLKANAPELYKNVDARRLEETARNESNYLGKESFMEYTARSLGVPVNTYEFQTRRLGES